MAKTVLALASVVAVSVVGLSAGRAQTAPGPLVVATGGAGEGAEEVRVIAFHPWGGRARAFYRSIRPEELGCRARFVFLQADEREPPGFAWLSRRALDPDQGALATEVRTRADEMARTIAALPPARATILAGYSEGAMVALGVGLLHPEIADALVVAAGTVPRDLFPRTPPTQPRFVLVHGRADPFVPFASTQALARALGSRIRTIEGAHRFRGALRSEFRRALAESLTAVSACGGLSRPPR